MAIALTIVIVLLTAFMLVRLRVRAEFSPERRTLFVGLGRTGPEVDFVRRSIHLRLSGLCIKSISMDRPGNTAERAQATVKRTPKEKPDSEQTRRRSFGALIDATPQAVSALWKYIIGLFKATIIERAEGKIEVGFAEPHVTGQVYGCYQVALGMAPGLFSRFQYVPVWTGPSFSGRLNVCVAWPVYRLLWQTAMLVWRLPKRKLWKLAIGEKKGANHVR